MNEEALARFWVKVDKTGDCWEWTAALTKKGYGAFSLSGTMRRSHRIAYELANGPIPEGMMIDHMCHNRACVNPAHLRVVSEKQNQENRFVVRAPSGIRGVHFDKSRRKWRASVKHNGRCHFAGEYTDPLEAEVAVIALRNRLFTHNDRDRLDTK